jgi:hypothetical protein
MSLHRRPLGRGRWIAALAAILIAVGCVLPWFRAGGAEGLPALDGNGFYGPGILVFLAALATLALVALPYAMGDRPTAVDRWWVYGLLAGIGALGLLLLGIETPPATGRGIAGALFKIAGWFFLFVSAMAFLGAFLAFRNKRPSSGVAPDRRGRDARER